MRYPDVVLNEFYEMRSHNQQAHEFGTKVMVRALASGWVKARGDDRGVKRSTLTFPDFNHTFEGTWHGRKTNMVIVAIPDDYVGVTFELVSASLLTPWAKREEEVAKALLSLDHEEAIAEYHRRVDLDALTARVAEIADVQFFARDDRDGDPMITLTRADFDALLDAFDGN